MDEGSDAVVNTPSPAHASAVGIDLGATLTKLAIRDHTGQLHFETLPSKELPRIHSRIETLAPVQLGLTGGGATRLAERLDRSCARHDEFAAWGIGARQLIDPESLAADPRNLLVSLGTGTSVLLMDGDTTQRIGGTALGGGTVMGIANALLNTADFSEICRLALRGDRSEVDLVVSDVYRRGEIDLPDELTAASFGKLALAERPPGCKKPENLAAAILGLVGENVGLICAGLSYASQAKQIVYGGSTLRDNLVLRNVLHSITSNMGRTPIFLPHGEFSGAAGALAMSCPSN